MDNVKIEGAEVAMGGKKWVIPALSLGQIKRLTAKIQALSALSAMMTDQQVDDVCEIVHAALSRNYPDLKKEEVEDMVDMSNMKVVIKAVMGQSGLVPTGEAEAVSR